MTDYNKKEVTTRDFRPDSIKKALMNNAYNHWSVRYALPIIGIELVSGFLFGFNRIINLGVLFSFLFPICRFGFTVFINGDNFVKKYINKLNKELEIQRENKLKDLYDNLTFYKCNKGMHQLDDFEIKFNNLVDMLDTKFINSQLTYQRYYGIAQDVYLGGIENLNEIITSYKILDNIDIDHIKTNIKKLSKNKNLQNYEVKELDALNRSNDLYNKQNEKIESLISQNSTALLDITTTLAGISEIKRKSNSSASVDMENSMNELQKLSNKLHLYG